VALCAAFSVTSRLSESTAAFVDSTSNGSNSLSSLTVAPPTNLKASMTLNILPLLTCRSNITWTASTTAGIDGYEVVRINVSDGSVAAGPWTTTATSYLDNPVPLQLLGNNYEWHVRTLLSSWRSTWETATDINLLACLL